MFNINDLPERVSSKIHIDTSGCWVWTGGTRRGYGQIHWEGRSRVGAHRLVYHLLVDAQLPVRPGRSTTQDLDHLCRLQACVNPDHLEIVSTRENVLRGRSGDAGQHSSALVGVYRDHGRWRAQITLDTRTLHLGAYDTEDDAARVYDAAALLIYGDATNHRLGRLVEPPTVLAIDLATIRIERARRRRAVVVGGSDEVAL